MFLFLRYRCEAPSLKRRRRTLSLVYYKRKNTWNVIAIVIDAIYPSNKSFVNEFDENFLQTITIRFNCSVLITLFRIKLDILIDEIFELHFHVAMGFQYFCETVVKFIIIINDMHGSCLVAKPVSPKKSLSVTFIKSDERVFEFALGIINGRRGEWDEFAAPPAYDIIISWSIDSSPREDRSARAAAARA